MVDREKEEFFGNASDATFAIEKLGVTEGALVVK